MKQLELHDSKYTKKKRLQIRADSCQSFMYSNLQIEIAFSASRQMDVCGQGKRDPSSVFYWSVVAVFLGRDRKKNV